MRVLAVDPGYDRLGVAVLEHHKNSENLLHSGCILTNKVHTLPDRLNDIGFAFEALLTEHRPDAVAVESLFFNKNQKTGISVAQARGVIVYLAKKNGCHIYEYTPQEVKIAVTGYGKSDKRGVMDMVKKLVSNVPDKAFDDEYDAIAIGITCLAHQKNTPQ